MGLLVNKILQAQPGEIAQTVILSGDPRRTRHLAETFLQDIQEYSAGYGLWGCTGVYQNTRISFQTSGMGTTSMSECVQELIEDYGCKTLIRVGSCASNHPNVHVGEVILSAACSNESNCMVPVFGNYDFVPTSDFELLRVAYEYAKNENIPFHIGVTGCCDLLYRDWDELPLLSSEMEGTALLSMAARYPDVKALLVMTCGSQLLHTHECIPAAKRSQSMYDNMMRIALKVATHRNGTV